MDKKQLIAKLKKLQDEEDHESAHYDADCLLLEFINDADIEKAYNKIEKWCS